MLNIVFKPDLLNLSVGSRIAFIRRYRKMSQNEVSNELGITGESKRRTITRYEKGDRYPKYERIVELSKILKVNCNLIRRYEFDNILDLMYVFMWLEEIIPNYHLDLTETTNLDDINLSQLKFCLIKWGKMRAKRNSGEITSEEYMEWKLNYDVMEDFINE